MNRTQNSWKLLTTLIIVLGILPAARALAFDHLEITVVNPHIVAGHPAATVERAFSVNVRAVNQDGSTDVTANFIHAQLQSPDVAASLPGSMYLVNGEFQFDNITFLAEGQPVRLRVFDADDGPVQRCVDVVFLLPGGDRFGSTEPCLVEFPYFVNDAGDGRQSVLVVFGLVVTNP